MKKKEQISDELLAKYMSGKASSEEEEAVLQYLAENDEHLDDFLNMVAAVELQRGKKKSIENKNVWKRVLWTASAAAAIAVLVVVGVFAFHHTEDDKGQLAQQEQTGQSQSSHTPTTVSDSVESNTDNTKIKQDKLEKGLLPAIQEPKHYADSVLKKNYAQMIFPLQKQTTISADKPSVTFRWRTDACKVHLLVTSDSGRVLADELLENKNAYKMKIADGQQKLNWSAAFTFPDGSTMEKSGEIAVENR